MGRASGLGWLLRSPADGRLVAEGGPAFVMAVEFGSPIRAQVLLPTGNADTDDGEQLKLTAAGALRPALLTRAEVEADRRARPVPPP